MKRVRITVPQRTDYTFALNWTAGGTPVDFTGCTASLGFRVDPDDAAPLLTLTTTPSSDGGIVLGLPNGNPGPGLVYVTISASGSMKLTPPDVRGDLLIAFPDGTVRELCAIDARVHEGSTY